MPYIVVGKDQELDPKKLCFRKYKNIWDIRYRETENSRSKTIYLQTPQLKLSMIEEDHKNYYLIFKIGKRDSRFWDLLAGLDVATVEDMVEDPEAWGYKEGTPLTMIESRMIPTLKMSCTNYEHSFHLVVPKTDALEVYDQDETRLDLSLLKRGYKVSLLLLLDGVELKNNYFGLKFVLEQAKAKIPRESLKAHEPEQEKEQEKEKEKALDESDEPPRGSCLIQDSEDGEASNYPADVSKYSHQPRFELYESDDERPGRREEEEPDRQREEEEPDRRRDEEESDRRRVSRSDRRRDEEESDRRRVSRSDRRRE